MDCFRPWPVTRIKRKSLEKGLWWLGDSSRVSPGWRLEKGQPLHAIPPFPGLREGRRDQ